MPASEGYKLPWLAGATSSDNFSLCGWRGLNPQMPTMIAAQWSCGPLFQVRSLDRPMCRGMDCETREEQEDHAQSEAITHCRPSASHPYEYPFNYGP